MEPKCLYCGNNTEYTIYPDWFACKNHGNVRAAYCINKKGLFIIQRSSGFYVVNMYIKYNYMKILNNKEINVVEVLKLPIDNSLTPENFNNKLKTYLTFQ